ncbi:MAG: hypothetical protein JSV25_11845 [Spirochaetota bacterium]|nr:MAG: hypothetical protein JSV25_11845 [Spirochaetota bacterium]
MLNSQEVVFGDQVSKKENFEYVSLEEAKRLFEEGALFIDTRDPLLYHEVHIEGAIIISKEELDQNALKLSYTNRRLWEYCDDCAGKSKPKDITRIDCVVYGDSSKDNNVHVVAKKLKEYKFRSLFILKDGFDAWQKAGYNIEQRADPLFDSSNIVFFYIPGCQSCIWAKKYLEKLLRGTDLPVSEKSMILKDNKKLREIYDDVYNVPADKRGIVPAIFRGSVALIGKDDIKKNLRRALYEVDEEPSSIHLRDTEDSDHINSNVIKRFEAFSPISVVVAGLLDGVNPCAFAVLVFFISYLAFTGREGRRLLWVGIIFIAAIFITYFLLGIGIFKFLHVLKRFQIIINLIYIATALVALTFAFYNITDSIKARRGDTKGLALQLSDRVKRLTHSVIRKHAGSKYIFIIAGFTGFLISLFEFGCTGQIYLPTIVYILNMPDIRYKALSFLGLYNVMFIVPLLFILFTVTFFEVNTTRIGQIFKKRIYLVKICTGGFFLFLAGYMIYISFRNFGLLG